MPAPHPVIMLGLIGVLLLGVTAPTLAGDDCGEVPCALSQLKHLCRAQLDQLFAQGLACTLPVGHGAGKVLIVCDARCPRLRAKLQSLVWKGKIFDEDGCFINQWLGFRAIRAHAEFDTSWFDGRPCIAMNYPPGTPVFGNVRDELREIGPGLYLGRMYETCPCPRFRGYFALKLPCGCCP